MTIPIAIIGAGAIAHDHVRAWRCVPGVEVRRVSDRHPERAAALAALAGAPTWDSDPDAAVADPAIRIVDICTPPDSHAALTLRAAAHGKAIHLEKPVALSLADVDPMLGAIKAAGVPFMVGQTARFQPVHLAMADAIQRGEIGRVRALHVTWYAGHVWPNGWRAWQLDPARCGGHLVHNGVHALDLAVWLLGATPTRVFARGFTTFAPEMPTPDSFHITLRCDDGSLALLELSYALRARGDALRRIVAIGETGSLSHSTEGEAGLHSDAARLPSPAVEHAFDHQLAHFAAVVRGEAEPIVTPTQVRATLAAALAAQRSYDAGRAISLDEVEP